MPRPTKLNDVLEANLVNAIRAGAFITTACEAFNVHPSTFHRWMASPAPRYRAFQDKIARATAEAEVEAITQVRRHFREDWRAAAWYLERKHHDRWGARPKVEVAGPEGGPIQVEGRVLNLDLSKLPPEAVAAIVQQLEEAGNDAEAVGDRPGLPAPRTDTTPRSG